MAWKLSRGDSHWNTSGKAKVEKVNFFHGIKRYTEMLFSYTEWHYKGLAFSPSYIFSLLAEFTNEEKFHSVEYFSLDLQIKLTAVG